MADIALKIRVIAWTAVQETVRRKVFYLVAFMSLLIVAIMASQMATVSMATEAGETTVVRNIHASTVEQILGMWGFATTVLALYLGAVAISSEAVGKTLVNVLSRPVDYWTYLAGRWLGVVAFLFAFQLVGVLLAVAAVQFYGVAHAPTLWLGCSEGFVAVVYLSGVSLGLSTAMPPMLAGGLAWLLKLLPMIVADWLKHPGWVPRVLAHAAYYVGPANMPVDLISSSFNKELLHPAYGLYARVLGENALYAIVVFAIGCAVFSRREARLR